MHNRADTVDAFLCIPRFPIPDAPVQSLGLSDGHGLRCHPRRVVGRQSAGDLFKMLKSYADMEPVEHRRFRKAGIGQNASKASTTIGEGCQCGVFRSADGLKVSADRHFDVRVGSGDSAKNLAAADAVSTLPTRASR